MYKRQTPRTRGFTIMRDAALSLALDFPFASQFANPRNMTPYEYYDSPLTLPDAEAWDAGPPPGAAAPDARLDGARINGAFLMDGFGPGFTVLTFGDVPGTGLLEEHDLATVLRLPPEGEAADVYGAGDGDAVLVRPDRFIAARWHRADGAAIRSAITRICAGGLQEDGE